MKVVKVFLALWAAVALVAIGVAMLDSSPSTQRQDRQEQRSAEGDSPEKKRKSKPREPAAPQWSHHTSRDEMTGDVQAFATSPHVKATRQMSFPYGDVEGFLGFGCDGQDEWVYAGFTEAPNLTNTEAQSGGYSTFTTRVRWDDDLRTMRMMQRWGERFLHFQDDATATAKIAGSQAALLELEWYGSGNVYFRIPLDGSADAISRARQACSS